MKLRQALPLIGGLSLLALAARGDAPAEQYAPFNKDDLTITDKKTALEWQRNVLQAQDIKTAAAMCKGLPGGPFRLPTVKELLTLVDEVPHEEFDGTRAIDRNAFPGTPIPRAFATLGSNWVVYFDTGRAESVTTLPNPLAVRCVFAKP
jgi:hypothetical protein